VNSIEIGVINKYTLTEFKVRSYTRPHARGYWTIAGNLLGTVLNPIQLASKHLRYKQKLENLAIANALQLEAVRATPVLFCFKSLNLSIAVL